MCGIIGIVGVRPVTGRLIESLKRLEYRGYDSAGVAGVVDGHIERRRAEGKLARLELALGDAPLAATVGIGHTRWATHGVPSERNAHPHTAGRVTLVHNGIIENFAELKAELIAKGHVFESETDTEVVAHLIDQHLQDGLAPLEALKAALDRLRGAYALVLMIEGEAETDPRRAARAGAGGGLRRGRDVPGLGRAGGGPLHQPRHPSRGRRLRGDRPAGRAHLRRVRRAGGAGDHHRAGGSPRWSRRATTATSWRRRSTTSRTPCQHTLSAYVDPVTGRSARARGSTSRPSSACRSSPAAPPPTPA